uniref:Uncharacterized protein n=1 Tax=Oryza punctata TaxID=4537 RepID=A0A0E0LZQ9_ORYPU
MAAYNITSNSPKAQARENLAKKMYTKYRKRVNKAQLEYIWGQCYRLGRDPLTAAIVTDGSWRESKNRY